MDSDKTENPGAFHATRSTSAARTSDRVATGVLAAIVGVILVALVATIGYIIVSGAGKLFDWHFLTSMPEQFKEGGGIGPRSSTPSTCSSSRF